MEKVPGILRLARVSPLEFYMEFLGDGEKAVLFPPEPPEGETAFERAEREELERELQFTITPWDRSLLAEVSAVVRLYAQTWDYLHSGVSAFPYEVEQAKEGFEGGFARSRNNLIDALYSARSSEFSHGSRELTARDGVDLRSSLDAKVLARIAIPGESVFRLMKDLKRNGFPDLLERAQKVVFPLYDLSTFKWGSEFDFVFLARTEKEKRRFAELSDRAAIYKEKILENLSEVGRREEETRARLNEARANVDWAAAAEQSLDFARRLINPEERSAFEMVLRESPRFNRVVASFKLYVLGMARLRERRLIVCPDFRSDERLREEASRCSSLDLIKAGTKLSNEFELALADLEKSNALRALCPRTLQDVRAFAKRERNAWEKEDVPQLLIMSVDERSVELLRGHELNLSGAKALRKEKEAHRAVVAEKRKEERSQLRELFLDNPDRAVLLKAKDFARMLLNPEDMDPEYVLKTAGPLFRAVQVYELAEMLCAHPEKSAMLPEDLTEILGASQGKTYMCFVRLRDKARLGSIDDCEKEQALDTALKAVKSRVSFFKDICPFTVKDVRRQFGFGRRQFCSEKNNHLRFG